MHSDDSDSNVAVDSEPDEISQHENSENLDPQGSVPTPAHDQTNNCNDEVQNLPSDLRNTQLILPLNMEQFPMNQTISEIFPARRICL